MKYLISLNFLIIIIINIFVQSLYLEESFQTEYILTDNQYNVEGATKLDKNIFHQIILSLKKTGKIDKRFIESYQDSKIKLYVDPYIDYYVLNNEINNEYNDGIFICLTPNKMKSTDKLWNLENSTIAYNSISDYLFIQALIKGYRLNENKIKLVKINIDNLQSEFFDFFFTYVVINSKYMKMIEISHYYINGLVDIDINRILPFYPFLRNNSKSIIDYFSKTEMKEFLNPKNNVLIPLMNLSKISVSDIKENFITRLQEDIGFTSKEYSCFGDIDVYNKYACDSKYNIFGEPKGYYSIWDKKCFKDSDCPFYKANKNYPNNRGGCIEGSCEFPSGMNKIGFKNFDDIKKYPPFCYGCSDKFCCETQEIPDYVFPNDFKERKDNKMTTIVSLLDYENY